MAGARGLTRPLVIGRRFVIHGVSRLTVRVARLLSEELAQVVVVAPNEDDELVPALSATAEVVRQTGSLEEAFTHAGLPSAQALLLLGDDEAENLHAAVVGHAVAPAVPLVLRTLNPALGDQLESGLNVRRAYSVSRLAAPTLVAAALSEEVVQTMHLGEDEITLCRVLVNRGSPLAGSTTDHLESEYHLALLARSQTPGSWEPATGGESIREGDEILVGGPISEVLELAMRDHTIFGRPQRRRTRRARGRRPRRARRGSRPTLLPAAAAGLGFFLLAAGLVFAFARDLNPLEAAYFTVTTAFGEQTLGDDPPWLKVLAIVTAIAGAALAAVLFSQLAALATAQRLEERAGRRARRLAGHIVVAGLGTVGYRVVSRIADLGLPVVAVERAPDPRFREALGDRAPVLTGDVQMPESLERARIEQAECLIACTNDDVANVLACLHARRLKPGIRTVARIFDEGLAERADKAFGIDAVRSTTGVSADAFANAATDERAPRPMAIGSVPYLMVREVFEEEVPAEEIKSLESEGVHLLAFRRGDGPVEAPNALAGRLEPGDSAVFAGPEAAVRPLLLSD